MGVNQIKCFIYKASILCIPHFKTAFRSIQFEPSRGKFYGSGSKVNANDLGARFGKLK